MSEAFFFFPSSSYRQTMVILASLEISKKKKDVKKVQRLAGISLSTALWLLASCHRLQRFKTIKENLIKNVCSSCGSFHNSGQ